MCIMNGLLHYYRFICYFSEVSHCLMFLVADENPVELIFSELLPDVNVTLNCEPELIKYFHLLETFFSNSVRAPILMMMKLSFIRRFALTDFKVHWLSFFCFSKFQWYRHFVQSPLSKSDHDSQAGIDRDSQVTTNYLLDKRVTVLYFLLNNIESERRQYGSLSGPNWRCGQKVLKHK